MLRYRKIAIGLVLLTALMSPAVSFAAIAFDTNSASICCGPNSWNHIVASDATLLLVEGFVVSGGAPSAVTAGGNAMTQIATVAAGSQTVYLYAMLNPPTGTVAMSVTAPGTVVSDSVSYKGVGSIGPTSTLQQNNVTTATNSVTPTKANSWVLMATGHNGAGGDQIAGTGSTHRGPVAGPTSADFYDSNGTVPVSSYSMSVGFTSPPVANIGLINVVLEPIAAASASPQMQVIWVE